MQDEISSPTFTIVNEYHNNKADIYHFDLYRVSDIYEFENIKAFEDIMKYTENVDNVIRLKKNALESYKKFDKEVAIKVLTDFIDNKSKAK